MAVSTPLPVIMPAVATQRWSCHSCGRCCRGLVVHLVAADRERIDRQDWRQRLGVEAYVRLGRSWALNKSSDGACVFLDDNNHCRIHADYGEDAKPLACRIFPFSVRAVSVGWQASLRFDCPSVTRSDGKPIDTYRSFVQRLSRELPHGVAAPGDLPDLQRGVRATPEEVMAVLDRYERWLTSAAVPVNHRLIGLARVTTTLGAARYDKVRGSQFVELLDLLFAALDGEAASASVSPTNRQRAMLRQAAFAHAEHVSHEEMRVGLVGRLGKRWAQLRSAKRFLKGRGDVPLLAGVDGRTTFSAVAGVAPADEDAPAIEEMMIRYALSRIQGRSVFGDGYYGWSVFGGLAALCLCMSASWWIARYAAAAAGRERLCFDDVAQGVWVVDAAATRAPVLGTSAERFRLSYLLRDDALVRLCSEYLPTEHAT